MPADPERQVGTLWRKLGLMRLALDEASFERTVHRLLHTLGACAMREAEERAAALGARASPATGDLPAAPGDRRGADASIREDRDR